MDRAPAAFDETLALSAGDVRIEGRLALLIVGGRDEPVIELNRQALGRLQCEKRLAIVPGATHLFEEAGTLQQAAALAADWFATHFHPEEDPR